MLRFSKESSKFLKSFGPLRQTYIQPIPPSSSMISPGDLLIFKYSKDNGVIYNFAQKFSSLGQRIVLIVSCKRGKGSFPGRKGTLISCFKITDTSPTVVKIILNELYKKNRTPSYYGSIKNSLIAILGANTFHTYQLNKMHSINKVNPSS